MVSLYEVAARNQREHRRNQLPPHRQHRPRWLSALAARRLGPGRRPVAGAADRRAADGERFLKLYSNGARQGAIESIDLDVEAIPRRMQVELETARLVSSDIVHAGDTVVVEATVRPWQQPARNVRIPVKLPARLECGQSAPAGLRCRYAGPDAGSAATCPTRAPISRQCWRKLAGSTRPIAST